MMSGIPNPSDSSFDDTAIIVNLLALFAGHVRPTQWKAERAMIVRNASSSTNSDTVVASP
jgi:hypothetical protein